MLGNDFININPLQILNNIDLLSNSPDPANDAVAKIAKEQIKTISTFVEKMGSYPDLSSVLSGNINNDMGLLHAMHTVLKKTSDFLESDEGRIIFKKEGKAEEAALKMKEGLRTVQENLIVVHEKCDRAAYIEGFADLGISRTLLSPFTYIELIELRKEFNELARETDFKNATPEKKKKIVQTFLLCNVTLRLAEKGGVAIDRGQWNKYTAQVDRDDTQNLARSLFNAVASNNLDRVKAVAEFVNNFRGEEETLPLLGLAYMSPILIQTWARDDINSDFRYMLYITLISSHEKILPSGERHVLDIYSDNGVVYPGQHGIQNEQINPDECKKILTIAAGRPQAVNYFLNESLQANKSSATLYERICDLPKSPEVSFRGLVDIVDLGCPEVASHIVDLAKDNPQAAMNVLEFCKSGYLEDAKLLIEGQDPLSDLLLRSANGLNGGVIHAALNLLVIRKDNRELALEVLGKGLNDYNARLILLAKEGRGDVVASMLKGADRTDFSFSTIKMCIEQGRTDLAAALYDNPDTMALKWGEAISKHSTVTPEMMGHLLTLSNDLTAIRENEGKLVKLALRHAERDIQASLSTPANLENKLLSIQLGLMEGPGKGIRDALDVDKILENRLVGTYRLVTKSKRQRVIDKIKKTETEYGITTAISFTLLSSSGGVSPLLAARLLGSPSLRNQIKNDPELSSQIERTVGCFAADADMGVRLSQARVPQKKSTMDEVVRQQLGIGPREECTKQQICSLIFSGLLTPTRQGKIGSCFSTSLVIQQEKTTPGIRQILEDHLALVNDQRIKRVNPATKVKNSFGGCFEIRNNPVLSQGHLLNRVREFTLASMGHTSGSDLKRLNRNAFCNLFIQANKSLSLNQDFLDALNHEAGEWFDANTSSRFVPTMENSETGEMGGWELLDGEGTRFIVPGYLLHYDCLQAVLKKMSENPEFASQINRMDLDSVKQFLRFNLPNLASMYSSGGSAAPLVCKNEERTAYVLRHQEVSKPFDLLRFFDQYLRNTSAEFKEIVQNNPDFLIPLRMPGHALSFEPSKLMDDGLSNFNENVWRLHDRNVQFKIVGAIEDGIKGLFRDLPIEKDIVEAIFKESPGLEIGEFWNQLKARLEEGHYNTQESEARLSNMISMFPGVPSLVFADSNWDQSTKLLFNSGINGLSLATRSENGTPSALTTTKYKGSWSLPMMARLPNRFNLIRS